MIYLSRPFSYNDENFTVIGTLLIVHIPFSGTIVQNTSICPIPPEISKRMPYKAFIASYNRSLRNPIPSVQLFVENNKIIIADKRTFKDGEFFGIVDLKDI